MPKTHESEVQRHLKEAWDCHQRSLPDSSFESLHSAVTELAEWMHDLSRKPPTEVRYTRTDYNP